MPSALKDRRAQLIIRGEDHDACRVFGKAQLLFGAQHATRFFTSDFRALDFEVTWQYSTDLRQGNLIARFKILGTTNYRQNFCPLFTLHNESLSALGCWFFSSTWATTTSSIPSPTVFNPLNLQAEHGKQIGKFGAGKSQSTNSLSQL